MPDALVESVSSQHNQHNLQIAKNVLGMNAMCSTSGHCVKLGLWCAQCNHVLSCTNNIDDVITKPHDHAAESRLIFAVVLTTNFVGIS